MNYHYNICKLCKCKKAYIKYSINRFNIYECPDCGFKYIDHLDCYVSKKERYSILTSEKKHYIESQLQYNIERLDRNVKLLLRYFDVRKKKILDVGCGGGVFLSKIREVGAEVYGIELDDARAQYCLETHNLNVEKIPIEHEYWQNNYYETFDAITFWDVIEHVNFPVETLKSASRLLKPGGILLLDTPRREAFFHQFGEFTYKVSKGKYPTFLKNLYSDHEYGHKQIFSKQDIQKCLNKASLKLIEINKIHELTFPPKFYLRRLFESENIINILSSIASLSFKIINIKNKMIVVGKKL